MTTPIEERLARLEGAYEHLATKGDIADLRGELKGDIADLRGELKGDIADLRGELKADIAKGAALHGALDGGPGRSPRGHRRGRRHRRCGLTAGPHNSHSVN